MSRLSVSFGIATACALASGPAAAQYYYGPSYPAPYSYNVPPPPGPYYGPPRPYGGDPYAAPRTLSPSAVVERLEDQGYDDVGRPRFTGTLYIVEATAPGDIRMRVVVDAVRGIVLNRTALGEPRRFDPRRDEDDEAQPPRRYGARPGAIGPAQPGPALERLDDPAARRRPEPSRPSREAVRPIEPAPGALAAPADPRLSPGTPPAEAAPAAPADRQAARTPPPTRAKPETDAKPYGLNPGSAAPAKPRPAEVARTPDKPADMARRPVPSRENGVANRPVQGESAAADATSAGPKKPVRVIGGVTPMSEGAPTGPAQLDNLPPPPAAPAPTGAE